MENYNGFSEENLREIAKKKVVYRFALRLHLSVFLIVNILLVFINIMTPSTYPWAIYPIFGWLIGVAEHATAYLIYARGIYPNAKRGVIFHSIAYIFVNLFLFIINSLNNAWSFSYYSWFIFPLIFWGTSLLIHIAVYLIFSRSKSDDEGITQSKREKAIEREIKKMKSKFEK